MLKPYYTCEDSEESIYFSYNQKIIKLLSNAYAEICELSGGNCNIPESWKTFSFYLKERDLFGSKYKEEWYFSGFYNAAKDFVEDLKEAVQYMSYDIEEVGAEIVNRALKHFETEIKNAFKAKISELEQ